MYTFIPRCTTCLAALAVLFAVGASGELPAVIAAAAALTLSVADLVRYYRRHRIPLSQIREVRERLHRDG